MNRRTEQALIAALNDTSREVSRLRTRVEELEKRPMLTSELVSRVLIDQNQNGPVEVKGRLLNAAAPRAWSYGEGGTDAACRCGCTCYYCDGGHNHGARFVVHGHASYCATRL